MAEITRLELMALIGEENMPFVDMYVNGLFKKTEEKSNKNAKSTNHNHTTRK